MFFPDTDPGVPEYPYYHVVIFLSHGSDLPAMDSCGTSDPYAKFYWKSKQVFKSKIVYKELNPVWDETFILAIDDPSIPVDIKVRQKALLYGMKNRHLLLRCRITETFGIFFSLNLQCPSHI